MANFGNWQSAVFNFLIFNLFGIRKRHTVNSKAFEVF